MEAGATNSNREYQGRIMAQPKDNDIVVECPCCGARLSIDAKLHRIVSHEAPAPKRNALDLGQAAAMLKEQAARREAIFKQSSEDVKIQSQLLERKFEAALEKSKDEPVQKPTRDIDLD
jgi:hypothetical protein